MVQESGFKSKSAALRGAGIVAQLLELDLEDPYANSRQKAEHGHSLPG